MTTNTQTNQSPVAVISLTLNAAIDRTVTIPHFSVGQVNRVELSTDRAGGKGVNVAATLADLGCGVAVGGFLGEANDGIFRDLFAAKGIADHCLRLPGATRVGIKVMDPVSQETTDINFSGLVPTEADLVELQRGLLGRLRQGLRVVLAGSLPPGVDPGFYADLTVELRRLGAEVIVDTSGEPLRQILAAEILPQVLKPNVHELQEAVGRELTDPQAVAAESRGLLARGAHWVVVSMGAAGAVFTSQDESLLAVPPSVAVRSTVGAGDAMVAGIVYGRCHGLSLAATARLATALSLDRLSHLGDGISGRDTVDAFASQVRVEPW